MFCWSKVPSRLPLSVHTAPTRRLANGSLKLTTNRLIRRLAHRRLPFLRESGAASVQQLIEQPLVVLAAPRPRETHKLGATLDAEAHWQARHGTFVKAIPAESAHNDRPRRRDRGLAIHRSPTPAR